jgi:hypothetical protein
MAMPPQPPAATPQPGGNTKECYACKSQIRADATKCPHCGTLQMGPTRRAINQVGLFLIILVAFGVAAAICSRA